MLTTAVPLAALAAAAYYSSQTVKDKVDHSDKKSCRHWIPENTWVYLEDPISHPRTIPGDYMEYDLAHPRGAVQDAVSNEENPVRALAILGDYEAKKDRYTMDAWTEFVKPKRELQTRSVSLPITQASFLTKGSGPDLLVKSGNRFYDAPVPRWTGTDTYYKRKQTVPYYMVP